MAHRVKNLHAMQEIQVRSLGGEDPLEKGMSTHSSILVWRFPWREEPCGLQSMGLQRVGHDRSNLAYTHIIQDKVMVDSVPIDYKPVIEEKCRIKG